MLNDSYSPAFWGCDLGTSNVALARRTTGSEEVESYFLSFKPDEDPYVIHCTIMDFVWRIGVPSGNWVKLGDQVFIEGVFMGLNARTFSRMTRVAHDLYIIFSDLDCEVEFIDNNAWRKTLFNDAKVKKDHGIKWALEKFPHLGEYRKTEREHRADAACIATAGMMMRNGAYDESKSPQSSGGGPY